MINQQTEKLYYADPYRKEFDAAVLSAEISGEKLLVVLDRTAFYPEGGGQPADHGTLAGLPVTDVHEKDGVIVHTCLLADHPEDLFTAGKTVHGILDWERRFDHMQQHSGEHIVSGMICSHFHCNNVGFHMGGDFITIDYDAPVSEDDLRMIEEEANRYIAENHPFEELWPTAEELKDIDYRSKKELTGAVRITRFPGADCCACCGTHVRSSAEVGMVKLFSVCRFREGVRIEMMSGRRLFAYLSACHDQNLLCSRATSSKPLETGSAVEQMKQEVIHLKGRVVSLENELADHIAASFAGAESPVYFTDEMESDSLRKLCVKIAAAASGRVIVLSGSEDCWKYAIIEEGADLRPFVKKFNEALNGRGGGRDGFAQGSLTATRKAICAFLHL